MVVLDTNQPTGLDGVFSSVTSLVGAPHNYSASDSSPSTSQPVDASRPVTALPAVTDVAGDTPDHAVVESAPQLTADQVRKLAVVCSQQQIVALDVEVLCVHLHVTAAHGLILHSQGNVL